MCNGGADTFAAMKILLFQWIIVFTLKRAIHYAEGCIPAAGDPDSAGNCSFQKGLCEWYSDMKDGLFRIQKDDNYFGFVNISERESSTASLVSPWICSEKDYNASLTFQFSTGQCSKNILSVFLNLNGTTRLLHTLTERDVEIMPPIYFNISDPNVRSFQIIIEGKRLESGHCERDGIYIDNILLMSPATDTFIGHTAKQDMSPTPASADDRCYNESQWDFKDSTQGWKNLYGYHLKWKRVSKWHMTDDYMAVDMNGQTSNSISRLESPWMCPMGDHQYSLSFQFYYGSIQKCELTLFLVTDSNVSCMVWKGTEDTFAVFKKTSTFLTAHETVFRGNKFKIIFEGRKLQSESCGSWFDEIAVDDVEYKYESSIHPSPASICTSTVTSTESALLSTSAVTSTESALLSTSAAVSTESPTSHETKSTLTMPQDHLLTVGSIAAVAIIIVVIIVALIIVIIVFLRRKQRKSALILKKERLLKESRTSHDSPVQQSETTIINTIYSSEYMEASVTENPANIYEDGDEIINKPTSSDVNLDTSSTEYYNTEWTGDAAKTKATAQSVNMTEIYDHTDCNNYKTHVLKNKSVTCPSNDIADTYDHIHN